MIDERTLSEQVADDQQAHDEWIRADERKMLELLAEKIALRRYIIPEIERLRVSERYLTIRVASLEAREKVLALKAENASLLIWVWILGLGVVGLITILAATQ